MADTDAESTRSELPAGMPEGSLYNGAIVIAYYLSPEGDAMVNTEIVGDEQGDKPSYFEALAMHAMAKDSIDVIYTGRGVGGEPQMIEIEGQASGCGCGHV